MKDGSADINRTLVFREVEAGSQTNATNQRFSILLIDTNAIGSREVIASNQAVRQLSLRLNEGKTGKRQMPAGFDACAVRIVLRLAAHRGKVKVARQTAVLADHVNEETVVCKPGTISSKAVGLVVGTAVRIRGGTIGIGKCTANLPAVTDINIAANLNRRALARHVLTAVFLFRTIEANPGTDAFGTVTKLAHALVEIVHVVTPCHDAHRGNGSERRELCILFLNNGAGGAVSVNCLGNCPFHRTFRDGVSDGIDCVGRKLNSVFHSRQCRINIGNIVCIDARRVNSQLYIVICIRLANAQFADVGNRTIFRSSSNVDSAARTFEIIDLYRLL